MTDEGLGWEGWVVLVMLATLGGAFAFQLVGLGLGSAFDDGPASPVSAGAGAPDFDPFRLGVGLALALLMIAAAIWIIRTTNWENDGEVES